MRIRSDTLLGQLLYRRRGPVIERFGRTGGSHRAAAPCSATTAIPGKHPLARTRAFLGGEESPDDGDPINATSPNVEPLEASSHAEEPLLL